MKKQEQSATRKTPHKTTTEQEYQQIFSPHALPFRGLYTDDDNLEQPSELRYVRATTSPYPEA